MVGQAEIAGQEFRGGNARVAQRQRRAEVDRGGWIEPAGEEAGNAVVFLKGLGGTQLGTVGFLI